MTATIAIATDRRYTQTAGVRGDIENENHILTLGLIALRKAGLWEQADVIQAWHADACDVANALADDDDCNVALREAARLANENIRRIVG